MRTICELCAQEFDAKTPYGLCASCINRDILREYDRLESTKVSLQRKSVPAVLTLREWLSVISDFRGKCAYCGIYPHREIDIVYDPDGLIYGNVVPICAACAKHKRNGFEWARQKVQEYLDEKSENPKSDILALGGIFDVEDENAFVRRIEDD